VSGSQVKRAVPTAGASLELSASAELASWPMDQVILWFNDVIRLPQYLPNIEELEASNGVGAWLSSATNESLYTELGITSKVHRKKILQHIAEQLEEEAKAKAEAQSVADCQAREEKNADRNDFLDTGPTELPPPVASDPPGGDGEDKDEESDATASGKDKKAKAGLFVCKYSGKKFKSKATYENHLRSKKYKQLEKKAEETKAVEEAVQSHLQTPFRLETAAEATVELHIGDEKTDGVGQEGPIEYVGEEGTDCVSREEAIGGKGEGGVGGGANDGHDSDSSEEEWFDDDTPWTPVLNESLFDHHQSKSFEENLKYMEKVHSFFIPYKAHLIDEKGLFSYLQEKVCLYHTCFYCKKVFDGLEACQNHMNDKSHKKINFDLNYGALELATFYDFTSGKGESGAAAAGPFVSVHDKIRGGELVLAGGGRAGSRTYKKYYNQQYRPTDNRVSVRINLRIQSEQSRWMGMHLNSKLAMRRERNMRNGLLVRSSMFAKGNSKALSSQFVFKQDAADNAQNRAIVHHWGAGGGGSHFNLGSSKQFQKGNKVKGIVQRGKKSRGNQVAIRLGTKSRGKKSTSIAILQ
jgi:hypothetical protein